MTLSIPDDVARRFQARVPQRQRSRLVARLLDRELVKHEDALARACVAANKDRKLGREISEWQAFEDKVGE